MTLSNRHESATMDSDLQITNHPTTTNVMVVPTLEGDAIDMTDIIRDRPIRAQL